MSRIKSHSYYSKARSTWSKVEFTDPTTAPTQPTPCTICSGEVEESPMMRDVCYDCYRAIVAGELEQSDPAELDGTEPSPYILGGEIFSPAFVSAHDSIEIPF